jgi:hypothetical protein
VPARANLLLHVDLLHERLLDLAALLCAAVLANLHAVVLVRAVAAVCPARHDGVTHTDSRSSGLGSSLKAKVKNAWAY